MTVKELYCYEREEGKITHSLEKPDTDYTLLFRLIADEDKQLTKDGENFITCIDVDSLEGWDEVEAPEGWNEVEALSIYRRDSNG